MQERGGGHEKEARDRLDGMVASWPAREGRDKAANLLSRKRLPGLVTAKDLAVVAASLTWERTVSRGGPQPDPDLDDPERYTNEQRYERAFDRYATKMLRIAQSELATGGFKKSRAVNPPKLISVGGTDGGDESSRDPWESLELEGFRSSSGAGREVDTALLALDVDAARLRIGDWLQHATQTGDADARFGDPVVQAAALLYVILFAVEHLGVGFWPTGLPWPTDPTRHDSDIDLRVALWLADSHYFDPVSVLPRDRKRRNDARKVLAGRAAELGLSIGGGAQ